MASFQHLGLLSSPKGLDLSDTANESLRRQDSFMSHTDIPEKR